VTTPTTTISLLDIQNEFGGTAPISLAEYYAGGGLVGNPPPTSIYQTGPIPTSGTNSLGNYRGLGAAFIFNDIIGGATGNLLAYNLSSRAIAAGWNGSVALKATITDND